MCCYGPGATRPWSNYDVDVVAGYARQMTPYAREMTVIDLETKDYSRLVACSDGEFRPPIAAEAIEKTRK